MKVSELIDILKACPQDTDVHLAWDSFVCTQELYEREQVIVVTEKTEWEDTGVYLCAVSKSSIQDRFSDNPSAYRFA